MRAVGCNMSKGNDGNSLKSIHGEETLESLNMIVAHPTCAQISLSRCQTEVLHGNAEIDVAMRFVVVGTNPIVVHVLHAQHIHRCCLKPVAVVASTNLFLCLIRGDHEKLPWLSVAGRRSQSHTVHDIVDVSFADRFVRKLSRREALCCQFLQCHS